MQDYGWESDKTVSIGALLPISPLLVGKFVFSPTFSVILSPSVTAKSMTVTVSGR